jgi:ABC-2 type transport system permease protein
MAATSISTTVAAPKKRARGLAIAMRALSNSKIVLSYGAFYAFFIAVVIGFLYPSIRSINMNAYLTSSAVAGLLGAKLSNANSYSALAALELYSSFYALIWGGIVAYIAGSTLPASIENGTLDLALSRPISRTRYYLEVWLGAVIGAVILSVATCVAVWVSTLFVQNAGIDWTWLIIAESIELAAMFLAAGIGVLFGSFMNASRASGGAAIGVLALFYLMNTLGSLSNNLSWMLKIEPMYYTQGVQALAEHNITGWYPLVLIAGGLVCGIVGLVIFNKRDLPTV